MKAQFGAFILFLKDREENRIALKTLNGDICVKKGSDELFI